MVELDDAIKKAGGFGICQIVFVTCASVFMSLIGANMAASIFEAMPLTASCKSPYEEEVTKLCPGYYKHLLTPMDNEILSVCQRYKFTDFDAKVIPFNFTNFFANCSMQANQTNFQVVKCDSWTYDRSIMRSTIVSDFNLVCGNEWAGYFSQSALMFGVGVGSTITGYLSDRLGRRRALVMVTIGSLVTGSLLCLVQSFWTYSLVRAIFGTFVYAPFVVLFVHASELTTPRYRSVVAQFLELSFPFGFCYLAYVSYLLREWRHIQLAISVPFILGGLLFWLTPESPRWLLMKNRETQAIDVITRIAKINRTKLMPENAMEEMKHHPTEQRPQTEGNAFRSMFTKPNIRSASLRLFYNWFAVSCVYYGLTLNAAILDGDPFRNLWINSAAEIVAVLLTIPLVNTCGRILTTSVSDIAAGVFCILIQFIPQGGVIAAAIIGKFFISVSFSTMVITTNEIYPTEIRNFAVGLCSAMARVGGIVSPLIAMTSVVSEELPYLIFGILSIIAGFVVLGLPETRTAKLTQTIQEGEDFLSHGNSIFAVFRKRISRRNNTASA